MTFWFWKITQQRSKFALTLSNAEAFLCFQYLPWQKKKKMQKRLNSQQLLKLLFQEKEKIYFCSRKKRNVALNKKVIFVFLTIFKLGFHYYPQMSVLSFHFFSFILVFNKRVIERILILPYSYKLQKIKKMNERKSLAHQIVAAEYVAEQITFNDFTF